MIENRSETRTEERSALVIVAALPSYRRSFVEELRQKLGGIQLTIAAGDEHIDSSVKTDAAIDGVVLLRNRVILGRRLLWQSGALRMARGNDLVVVDLNPRSLSAWAILISRRLRGKKTLVWGHILPRRGKTARTVPLRRSMRRLADGVISYTWNDRSIVTTEDPRVPVWVAANGLYPAKDLNPAPVAVAARTDVVYVGRLVEAKRPQLLLDAFIELVRARPDSQNRLVFAGKGELREELENRAELAGVASRVVFLGEVFGFDALKSIYKQAICSVSPGYVGLSLTQSLGFGVPMVVADNEPHAPEVELMDEATGVWFRAGDVSDLRRKIELVESNLNVWHGRRFDISQTTAERCSSSAMADGFAAALHLRNFGSEMANHE